ncbi:MAG: hypothetical protein ABI680_19070, partial [Chthoniobacteraceae bacterium]
MAKVSRLPGLILLVAIVAGRAAAPDDDLPQSDGRSPLEFEPNLQLYDVKPDEGGPALPDLETAEADYERAKRREARWQKLQKAGVISKVEVEQAMNRTASASVRLARARVAHWRQQVEQLQARVAKGEDNRELLTTAEASLKQSEHLANDADALYQKRRLEFAEANLYRQKRLLEARLA